MSESQKEAPAQMVLRPGFGTEDGLSSLWRKPAALRAAFGEIAMHARALRVHTTPAHGRSEHVRLLDADSRKTLQCWDSDKVARYKIIVRENLNLHHAPTKCAHRPQEC